MDAVVEKSVRAKASKSAKKKSPKGAGLPDSIVTARVPSEIKEQGNAVLKSIGSSPTELVNSAYEYVLAEGKLPKPRSDVAPQRIVLSDEQKRILRERREKIVCKVPESYWQGKSYKELLEEAIKEKYETLD